MLLVEPALRSARQLGVSVNARTASTFGEFVTEPTVRARSRASAPVRRRAGVELSRRSIFRISAVLAADLEQAGRYRRFSRTGADHRPGQPTLPMCSSSSRGRARVVNYSVSGREITFADLVAGDYFGEIAAIDGRPRSAGVMARRGFAGAVAAAPAVPGRPRRLIRRWRCRSCSRLGAHRAQRQRADHGFVDPRRQQPGAGGTASPGAERQDDPQHCGDRAHPGAQRHRQPRLDDARDGGARAQRSRPQGHRRAHAERRW